MFRAGWSLIGSVGRKVEGYSGAGERHIFRDRRGPAFVSLGHVARYAEGFGGGGFGEAKAAPPFGELRGGQCFASLAW